MNEVWYRIYAPIKFHSFICIAKQILCKNKSKPQCTINMHNVHMRIQKKISRGEGVGVQRLFEFMFSRGKFWKFYIVNL